MSDPTLAQNPAPAQQADPQPTDSAPAVDQISQALTRQLQPLVDAGLLNEDQRATIIKKRSNDPALSSVEWVEDPKIAELVAALSDGSALRKYYDDLGKPERLKEQIAHALTLVTTDDGLRSLGGGITAIVDANKAAAEGKKPFGTGLGLPDAPVQPVSAQPVSEQPAPATDAAATTVSGPQVADRAVAFGNGAGRCTWEEQDCSEWMQNFLTAAAPGLGIPADKIDLAYGGINNVSPEDYRAGNFESKDVMGFPGALAKAGYAQLVDQPQVGAVAQLRYSRDGSGHTGVIKSVGPDSIVLYGSNADTKGTGEVTIPLKNLDPVNSFYAVVSAPAG